QSVYHLGKISKEMVSVLPVSFFSVSSHADGRRACGQIFSKTAGRNQSAEIKAEENGYRYYVGSVEANMIFETERLYLREMEQSDYEALCKILQDQDAMYAYEGAFGDDEVQEWLDRQIARYQKWGFGLWAVVLKENGEMIGKCGL